uniref:Uncharacterized protein n=1 Tax=Avena sativa TaxID=4498 RepID=A0ACD5ZI19_AVESA
MVYGAEAILPSDILHDAPRVAAYDEDDAEKSRRLDVYLLEVERVLACQRSAIYQQKLRNYHSRRVQHHSFKEGDLVLRLKQKKLHKLSPPWEGPFIIKGPFIISKALLNGSYYLVDNRELEDIPSEDHKRDLDATSSALGEPSSSKSVALRYSEELWWSPSMISSGTHKRLPQIETTYTTPINHQNLTSRRHMEGELVLGIHLRPTQI